LAAIKLKQNANEGCNSCASLAGLVLSFIACFILLVIAPLASVSDHVLLYSSKPSKLSLTSIAREDALSCTGSQVRLQCTQFGKLHLADVAREKLHTTWISSGVHAQVKLHCFRCCDRRAILPQAGQVKDRSQVK